MTCKDCYHYSCHKHWYKGFDDFDSRFNDTNVEIHCPEFKDKSKIIELPCKVGDTVYEITPRESISTYRITQVTVNAVLFFKWSILDGFYSNILGFPASNLGKTVFLTRKEAEKKLEELKNEKY